MNDVLDELKTAFEAAIGSAITTYYQGEVLLPPESYLPALMVFGNSTQVTAYTTGKDEVTYDITVRVVQSLNTKLSENGTGVIVKAHQDLVNIMEERDSNRIPLSTTVLGVIRDGIKGVDYTFNKDVNITYSTIQQGEFPYISADLTFTVKDYTLRT